MKPLIITIIIFVLFGCSENRTSEVKNYVVSKSEYFFDESRNRVIPMEIYENTEGNYENGVVIINAGYGCSNTEYTYLTRFLGLKNYLIVAIHHEQQNDEMLPSGENIYELRLPNWKEGVLTIEEAMKFIRKEYPKVSTSKINLIGHSNGGDISALYATNFPNKINALITLDHRRVPLPRTAQFETLSIRADEFEADKGVLPKKSEKGDHRIKVVQLKNVGHNFLRDNGTEEMKKEITSKIDEVL